LVIGGARFLQRSYFAIEAGQARRIIALLAARSQWRKQIGCLRRAGRQEEQ
jgi:hypothetical protein